MANPVLFYAAVVFQHQQVFHFIVPKRVEQGGRTTAHTALGAGLYGCLEILVERNAARMECFTATDRAADGTDVTGIDADTGTLADIFHDGAGRGVDGIQRVAAFYQDAGTELAGRGANAGHDRGRQRQFEGRHSIIETLDVIHPGVFWIAGEQAGTDQHIKELRALEVFAGNPVLHQVLAFQLFDGGIAEVHVAAVIQELVHGIELFPGVVQQQLVVVFLQFHQADNVIIERRRLKLTEGFLAEVENGQAGGQVLVVGGFPGDQVSSGFDQGLVDIDRLDAIVELNMGFQFYLGDGDIVQPVSSPGDNTVNFVEVQPVLLSVTLGDLKIFVHEALYL